VVVDRGDGGGIRHGCGPQGDVSQGLVRVRHRPRN
jgi:hypothetical protein